MVSVRKPRDKTYADYLAVPDGVRAELLDGELYLRPQPNGAHVRVKSLLGAIIVGRFGLSADGGPNGPGGWWILDEPECHLAVDRRVVIPDLAGWRRTRLPTPPADSHKFTVVPDWVCEVLSPTTASYDAIIKMPKYLEAGVQWAWLVDPVAQRIDVFRAEGGVWVEAGAADGAGLFRLAPFEAVELDLGPLWADG
jgi:Uma2 family endonuclease